jgi:uncharacterized membrane-anchored protein YhcB (DUF1043 family)
MDILLLLLGMAIGLVIGVVLGSMATRIRSIDDIVKNLRDQVMPSLKDEECFYIEVGKHNYGEDETSESQSSTFDFRNN